MKSNLAAYLALLPVAVLGLVAGILGLYLAAKARGEKHPSGDESRRGPTGTILSKRG